jgi:hypothetical protein
MMIASAPKHMDEPPVTEAQVPREVPEESSRAPSATNVAMATLAAADPVLFLEKSLEQYERNINGYRCVMQKQERLAGKLQPKEIIEAWFREKPHSVLFHWVQGARKAEGALYVAGQNGGKMLARPSGSFARRIVGDVVERDVDGPDAKQSGRYALSEFGMKKAMQRTLNAWKASKQRGRLHVEYLGEHRVKEAGDRVCYKLRRKYEAPENDGVTEITIYVEKESLLQVGSILKGEEGKLIGEYYFRDIHVNPTFARAQFERGALDPERNAAAH